MPGAQRGTGDEERERHQHARIAAAGGIKRARRAAPAELHSESEQERADKHGRPDRAILPVHRLAEQAALREHGKEQQHRHREHHHLRPQAGAASVRDEDAPGRGEAEQRVIEHEPERAAEQEQCALSPGVILGERERAGRHQRRCKDHHRRVDAGRFGALRRKQAGVNRKVGHGSISSSLARCKHERRSHAPSI